MADQLEFITVDQAYLSTFDLASSPLGKLSENKFESAKPMSFPLDVGGDDYPHYLLFNIFTPPKTKYSRAGGGGTKIENLNIQGGDINSIFQTAAAVAQGTVGLADAAGNIIAGKTSDAIVSAGKGLVGGLAISLIGKIQRDYKLLKQTIRLYVPETAQQTLNNKYNAVSLTEALGMYGFIAQGGASIGSSFIESVNSSEGVFGAIKSIPGAVKAGATSAGATEAVGTFGGGGLLGNDIKDLVVQRAGFAINPQLEILYESPSHREYQFTFRMTPKSQDEAVEMIQIARAFKFYSSPELSDDGGGRYYIPPAIFGISYMYNSSENKAMHKFLPSVLTSINVNYVTTGQFATYADGIPVEIEMVLQFQEIDVITKEKVFEGY